MEKVLTRLASSQASSPNNSIPTVAAHHQVNSNETAVPLLNRGQLPSGESLLKTQTLDAQDFLERAVLQGRVRHMGPSVQLAIVNLRGLVDRESRRPSSEYDMQPSVANNVQSSAMPLTMPPVTLAAPLLESAMSKLFSLS